VSITITLRNETEFNTTKQVAYKRELISFLNTTARIENVDMKVVVDASMVVATATFEEFESANTTLHLFNSWSSASVEDDSTILLLANLVASSIESVQSSQRVSEYTAFPPPPPEKQDHTRLIISASASGVALVLGVAFTVYKRWETRADTGKEAASTPATSVAMKAESMPLMTLKV